MGHELYREIRDYAPDSWTSGMRVVAWVIADDANDGTRRSWIPNALLCKRAGMKPSGVKTALQKLADAGYEMRVPHGTDSLGRPVYAVTGHSVDYLVPSAECLLGDATASPIAVDNPPVRRRHSIAYPDAKATPQHRKGDATASQGDAVASPLPSSPLTIPPITKAVDLAGPVENTRDPRNQDHPFQPSRRHPTAIERDAWEAIGARQ